MGHACAQLLAGIKQFTISAFVDILNIHALNDSAANSKQVPLCRSVSSVTLN